MKVATRTIYDNIIANLFMNTTKLQRLNQQATSGKRINQPSDDPVGASIALDLKTVLRELDQYERNIDSANAQLKATESTLMDINELLTKAKEISAQMATETYSAENRRAVASQVANISEEIMQLANTQLNGSCLLSGYRTDLAAVQKVVDSQDVTIGHPVFHGDSTNTGTVITVNPDASGYSGATDGTYLIDITNIDLTVGNETIDIRVSEDGGLTWTNYNGAASDTDFAIADGIQLRFVDIPGGSFNVNDRFTIPIRQYAINSDSNDIEVNIGRNSTIRRNVTASACLKIQNQDGVTITNEELVQDGMWVIEFSDSQSFSYSGPGGVTGAGVVGQDIDLSATAGLTFNIQAPASGSYNAGDRLTFLTTANVDGAISSAVQGAGSGDTPPTIGNISIITGDNIDSAGTTTLTRGASSLGAVTQGGDAVANPISVALNIEESIYQDSAGFQVSWNGVDTWSIAVGLGDYPAAAISGDATGFTLDLDNDGIIDITGTVGGAGSLGGAATGAFDLNSAAWTVAGVASAASVWDTGTAIAIDFDGGTTADATIAYSGARWENNDEITITTSLPGSASAISGSNRTVLDILDDLRAALVNNNTEGIADSLADLDAAQNNLLDQLADVGSRLERTAIREGLLDELKLQNEQRLSDVEDADLIEIITKLKNQQVAYQAALQASAMISQVSLADYI